MNSRNSSSKALDLSIVIPVFNEEGNIPELYTKLKKVLENLNKSYEIIFIDDGSTDKSFEILKSIHEKDKNVKVIRFRRNFGKTTALSAGFDYSRGEIIVTLDADLQNDPADIPLLLEKCREGFDFVNGWRADRKDSTLKKLFSKIYNILTSKITGVNLHDHDCGLKAFKKEILKNISLYGDLHRYLPALASWQGAKIAEVKVRHYPRRHGKSKYGFKRLLRGSLDLIVVKFLMDYSTRPMHFFGAAGFISFVLGFLFGAYLVLEKLLYGATIGNRPLLLLSILLMVVGVQLIMMGILGELLIRTYYEIDGKRTYVIKEILGDDSG